MKITEPYRLKLPILQWLLLVFLSAGLVNSSFQYQSIRPVTENTLYKRPFKATNSQTAVYAIKHLPAYIPATLNLQNQILRLLAKKLTTLSKLTFLGDTASKSSTALSTLTILPRHTTASSEPDLIFRS